MEHEISVEQKAHDLAIAYASYVISTSDKKSEAEDFYQEYENAYKHMLKLVRHYA